MKTVICCDRDTSQSLFFLGKRFLGTRVFGVLKVKVLSSVGSVCLYLGEDLCNGYFRNHPDMAEFQSITFSNSMWLVSEEDVASVTLTSAFTLHTLLSGRFVAYLNFVAVGLQGGDTK